MALDLRFGEVIDLDIHRVVFMADNTGRPSHRAVTPAGRSSRPSSPNGGDTWKRLSTPVPLSPPPPITRSTRRLKPAQLKASTENLYRGSLLARRDKLVALEEATYGSPKAAASQVRPLTPEDMQSVVDRLFAKGLADHEQRQGQLEKQYLAKSEVHLKRFSSKIELATTVDRLYNTVSADAERSKKLFEKYNWQRPPPPSKSPDELHEMIERYHKGGFARRHGAP